MEDLQPSRTDEPLTDEAQRCLGSLAEFIRAGWHVLEPSAPLHWNWHIPAIADHMQAALDDWMARQRWEQRKAEFQKQHERAGLAFVDEPPVQRIRNLLINVPPGTAKSRIVAVFATAWMWLKWPSWRVICLSTNPRVSLRDSDFTRLLIESEWYQETFRPAWKLSNDQKAKSLFRNTAGGARAAFGWMARITGDRADCLIFDDPHDAEEVKSDVKRKAVLDRYDSAIANRLNDLRTSLRIGVMQRVHEQDFSGHVLAQGGWEHLCIPQEFEPDRYTAERDYLPRVTAIGWSDPRTKPGELLFPVRFPAEILAAELTRLGAGGYAGQHQQRPSPGDGTVFRLGWFQQRYRKLPTLTEVWTCWDTALKDKEENDQTACVVAGLGEDGLLYILRVAHGHWETPDVGKFLIAQAQWLRKVYGERYRGDYVEDKVSGTTLMQYVRRTNPELAIIGIQVEGDKVARAKGVSPLCEALRVVLPDASIFPDTRPGISSLLYQLTTFPRGNLKDVVDAFVYCLMRLMGTLNRKKSRRRGGGTV